MKYNDMNRYEKIKNKSKKVLDRDVPLWYNTHLKSIISFLLGMLCTAYVFPPTPTAELTDMDKREIAYNVIEWLDDADWEALKAQRNIVEEKKGGWFN